MMLRPPRPEILRWDPSIGIFKSPQVVPMVRTMAVVEGIKQPLIVEILEWICVTHTFIS